MKTKYRLPLLFLPLLLCSFKSEQPIKMAERTFDGKAYDKSQVMDFSDSSEEEVKTYYGYDTMITKKGDELKNYLHDIISKDNYFVNYGSGTNDGGVGTWYRITDRNWDLSKPIDPSTYRFSAENPEDFYLVNFYFESSANYDESKATNNCVNSSDIKAVDGATKVDYVNKTKPKNVRTDKEHLWAKNHGFKVKDKNGSDVFVKGAPTDLHHLVAADGFTNSSGHNDNFFGEVKDKSSATLSYCYYADGTSAVSGYLGADEKGEKVFEPTDEWKGDIARALLYMGTRYGVKLEGGNTQAEPDLVFDDDGSYKTKDSGGKYDTSLFEGYHPNLRTYLKWNKEDPVSEYEYHRNNLIYKNVQKNRNPFVDYPTLADWVYGTTQEKEPEFVTPVDDNPNHKRDYSKLKEKYQLHVEDKITLDVILRGEDNVDFDESMLTMAKDKKTFTAKKAGTTTVTFHYLDDDGTEKTKTTTFEIKDKIILLSVKPDTGVIDHMNLVTGESFQFELGFKNNEAFFPDEKILYSTDDSSVIEVTDEGKVTGLKEGECTLYLYLKSGDTEKTLLTIKVKVRLSEEEAKKRKIYLLIIIIAAILLVLIFLIFYIIIKKTNKKESAKSYTKVYNKGGKNPKKRTTTNSKKKGKK